MIAVEEREEIKMDELQDYEIFEEADGYKLGRYEISTYVTQRSIESLIKWVDKKKIIVPDFQRDYVWSKPVASKLIDSVLLNLPIPNIFLYKSNQDGEEVFYVVDGFQRIQTLKYYKEGIWSQESDIKENTEKSNQNSTTSFKINYRTSEWYNKDYNSLSDNDRFNFDEYSINLTIFEQSNPKNKNSMFEVFERINTGSDKLSEQEIRNAIYPGDFLKEIRKKANTPEFLEIIENDSFMKKRQNYIDLYLRFVSYYYAYLEDFEIDDFKISSSKRETLNNFCEYFNNKDINSYAHIIKNVLVAIKKIYSFDKNSLYGKKRNQEEISNKVHAVFSEALVISVILNNNNIEISPEEFNKFKLKFWESDQFEKIFVQQTTTIKNIKDRVKLLLEVINNEYKD